MKPPCDHFSFEIGADHRQQTYPSNGVGNECKQCMGRYVSIEQPAEVSAMVFNSHHHAHGSEKLQSFNPRSFVSVDGPYRHFKHPPSTFG